MSIFVSTTYLGDRSEVQEAVNKLINVGITKIELGSNHAPIPNNESLNSFNDGREHEYIVHNYFPPEDPNFVLNLASENKAIREKSIAFIKNTIKICQKFGIKFYTIHPGFLGEAKVAKSREVRNFDFQFPKNIASKNRQKIINRTIKIIKDLYEFANNKKVNLLIENEGSQTSSQFVIFALPEELDMLKKGVGKSLKLNFNLAHATLAGINLKDAKIFNHFYKDAIFFEVSEIKGIFDSHLPILPKNAGKISSLVKKYPNFLSKKNVILEYRNINIDEVNLSYQYVNKLLDPRSPEIQ